MLQYILKESNRFTVAELAQMAVEGGCGWISLHLPRLTEVEIREAVAGDVVELCREGGVFLTIDDRPEIARDLGLHGVRLSRGFFVTNPGMSPMGVREDLGPEAVIGVETDDSTMLPALVAADIDFITLPPKTSPQKRQAMIDASKGLPAPIAVVAEGDFSPEEAKEIISAGCSGVAVGSAITDAPDPLAEMLRYIEALSPEA